MIDEKIQKYCLLLFPLLTSSSTKSGLSIDANVGTRASEDANHVVAMTTATISHLQAPLSTAQRLHKDTHAQAVFKKYYRPILLLLLLTYIRNTAALLSVTSVYQYHAIYLKFSYQIKSNLFAINKMHNITVHKITLHLAGQTGDSFALMSAHRD